MAQCKAHTSNGTRQCKNPSIPGGVVCRYHGGGAPQVKQAARERLLALVDPAIGALGKLVRKSKAEAVKLGAARDILDRTGYKPTDRVQVEEVPSEELEALQNLTDEELRAYIELRRKVLKPAIEVPALPVSSDPQVSSESAP
jgi:hypothetical protein